MLYNSLSVPYTKSLQLKTDRNGDYSFLLKDSKGIKRRSKSLIKLKIE
ncbi:hypothetical protein acsn021_19630 [Anaerocolumna cellulosilytica]|uniref:Uncharacterized protein n=1 Tax=Anaerocolumna cellulosilytica TaxID=433286 RepID=A0A6S6QUU5_9FIRM|nr:hypothetical protein acsn021_19630 [Anaerocolumna cellulosilytica]